MRCLSCDRRLTPFEATRKSKTTGDYIDLCNNCFPSIAGDIKVSIRRDLMDHRDEDDEDDGWEDYGR